MKTKTIGSSSDIVIRSGASNITVSGGNPYLYKCAKLMTFVSSNMQFSLTNVNNDYFRFGFNSKAGVSAFNSVPLQFGPITSASGFSFSQNPWQYLVLVSGDSFFIMGKGIGITGANVGTGVVSLATSITFIVH